MKQIKILSVVTITLFFFSLITYYYEHKRGTDLVSGSEFVVGLDIDQVAKIIVKDGSGKEIDLQREGKEFVLSNFDSFPASSKRLNDLLFQIVNIEIKEKVSSKKKNHAEFEVLPDKFKNHVSFFNSKGEKTIDFYIGKSQGRGTLIRFSSSDDVYLSKAPVQLQTEKGPYIDHEIIDVDQSKMNSLVLKEGNKNIQIKKDGSEYRVEGPNKNQLDQNKITSFLQSISKLSFKDFYNHTDQHVAALQFNQSAELKLDSKLIYRLELAKKDKKHFLKVMATLEEQMPQQVVINKNDDKEKLEGIEEMMKAQGKANRFNLKYGKWIFEIPESDYQKYQKSLKDFEKS